MTSVCSLTSHVKAKNVCVPGIYFLTSNICSHICVWLHSNIWLRAAFLLTYVRSACSLMYARMISDTDSHCESSGCQVYKIWPDLWTPVVRVDASRTPVAHRDDARFYLDLVVIDLRIALSVLASL